MDTELARLPDRGGVVYLPVPASNRAGGLDILNQASVDYGSSAHRRPTPNGYGGYFPPSFFQLHRQLAHLPDEASLSFLRRTQVRFVVGDQRLTLGGPPATSARPGRRRPAAVPRPVRGRRLVRGTAVESP